jgi:hypothetical protein
VAIRSVRSKPANLKAGGSSSTGAIDCQPASGHYLRKTRGVLQAIKT